MWFSPETSKEIDDWVERHPILVAVLARTVHAISMIVGLVSVPFTIYNELRGPERKMANAFIFVGWIVGSLALVVFLLIGCGPRHDAREETTSSELAERLAAKESLYRDWMAQHAGPDGFIEHGRCDSTLFSGLVAAVGAPINMEAARAGNGQWYRRSLALPECYATGQSKSTISRDMLVGVLWWGWRTKNLSAMEQLYRYGQDHDWIMGQGLASRTLMSPGLRATLAEVIYRLGGTNHTVARSIPQFFSEDNTDFPAHLDVLHILLRGELWGGITDSEREVIQAQVERNPLNPLFQYAWHRYTDGDQDVAITLLLDETYWPADGLPTGADRCTAWLPQRDQGPDWAPCQNETDAAEVYSGGDLVFVAGLILGR